MDGAWNRDWRARLSEALRSRGFESLTEYANTLPTDPLKVLAEKLDCDVGENGLGTVLAEEAVRMGSSDDFARSMLVRSLHSHMPEGWNRGDAAFARGMFDTAVGLGNHDACRAAWSALQAGAPPDGWLPAGPDDELVRRAIASTAFTPPIGIYGPTQTRRAESEPLLQALRAAGLPVRSLDDVARLDPRSTVAASTLIQLLHDTPSRALKSVTVDCLRKFQLAPGSVRRLIAEFEVFEELSTDPAKWTLGDIIRENATDELFEDIARIAKDSRQGRARQMPVLALGKMKAPAAVDVLIGLLDDEEMYGHAVSALATLASPRAAPHLKRFVRDSREWVRKAAVAGLQKIARRG
jgi:hypothetical protein